MAYLTVAAGNVKRWFNNPSRIQVYSVLRFRNHLAILGLIIWLAGIAAFYIGPASISWLDDVTGILLISLTAVGLFLSGCLMFPAVREAEFLAPDETRQQLSPDDPVIGLEINGEARAYPVKWMQEPQIVEDVVGGTPVIVTYCASCKSAHAFSIKFADRSLRLIAPPHKEDKMMLYDAMKRRLIQQETGEIVFGRDKGQSLPIVPTRLLPWVTWETRHPDSKVFYHATSGEKAPSLDNLTARLKFSGFRKGITLFNIHVNA
jgi:hypothetical protein